VIAALNTSNFALLLLGRALQGLGQGLAPMMIGIARAALAGRRQSSTISILSITNAAGVGLGYPLTGLLDRAFGIAGAFWIGGALSSALALIIAALVVPANRTQSEAPVDIIGSALFAIPVGALLLALAQGQTWGWSSAAVLVLFAAALVIGGVWVWQQLRTAHPLDFLTTLRYVDDERIGVLGVCAGGGYAVNAAMTEHRIKAVGVVSVINIGRAHREGGSALETLEAVGRQRTIEARGGRPLITSWTPGSPEEAR
jgi:MFS family permease